MIHYFKEQEAIETFSADQLPLKFTYPFQYIPHPLVVRAADEVNAYLQTRKDWQEELSHGKMFGVLLVQKEEGIHQQIGFLAAFSGNLAGSNHHEFFVPPVFDLLRPGDFFKVEESHISAINQRIQTMTTSSDYRELKESTRKLRETTEVQLKEAKAELKRAKLARDEERKQISERLAASKQHATTDNSATDDCTIETANEVVDGDSLKTNNTFNTSYLNTFTSSDATTKSSSKITGNSIDNTTDNIAGNTKNTPTENTTKIKTEDSTLQDETRLKELIRESQFQKAEFKRLEKKLKEETAQKEAELQAAENEINSLKQERKTRSAALQMKLFEHFRLLNARGEIKDLCQIFQEVRQSVPPAGAGECALPKLLQYAYLHHLKPLAFGEFWWGESPKDEIRHHGQFYPSCKGKCEPILQHMLVGLDVDSNPLAAESSSEQILKIIYEDEWLVAVEKPAGMLSTPGKEITDSVSERLHKMYPEATGPLLVHRLDMATSGLLLAAKTKEIHAQLQSLFEARAVRKLYTAVLDGIPSTSEGCINLPLCLNPMDRPRQMVSYEHGKEAITYYKVIATQGNNALVQFDLQTGRTHQIRMHAAHPLGLHCPIKGDDLYGQHADRLYLHATEIEFIHPVTHQKLLLKSEVPFITFPR